MIIETNSASETLALGEKLGKAAKPGQIYTLNGDLGVGKTVLTQGFEGLMRNCGWMVSLGMCVFIVFLLVIENHSFYL